MKTQIKSQLGANIRNRRKELGLSQMELAMKIGYTNKSTISKIESGDNDISQSNLIKFAEALETTVNNLLSDVSPENENLPTVGKVSPDKAELLQIIDHMTDDQIHRLVQIAKAALDL